MYLIIFNDFKVTNLGFGGSNSVQNIVGVAPSSVILKYFVCKFAYNLYYEIQH